MIITSTNSIQGYEITHYLGLVNANIVIGTNIISDIFASFSDVFGGTSGTYQSKLNSLYNRATLQLEQEAKERGADAIVGVSFDFDEISGQGKSMFMVTVIGTAVRMSPICNDVVEAKSNRFDIYQKLYDLSKYRDAGIITQEQYAQETKFLNLNHEIDIENDLAAIKKENLAKEAAIEEEMRTKALIEQREAERKAREAKELEERMAAMSEKERLAVLRKKNEQLILEKKNLFKSQSERIFQETKRILCISMESPQQVLRNLSLNEIQKADYSNWNILPNEKMAYVIGCFIKNGKIAEACKYYIDVVNDDDIEYAKSYVNSIYEMITFQNLSSFEIFVMNLIELKYSGQEVEAISEFAKYAICNKELAQQVVELL